MLRVKLVHPDSIVPQRKTPGSAGYDLTSCQYKIIAAYGWDVVDTGICIDISRDTYARIAPRSGLSLRGICVGAGVVDSDYRDTIKVVLYNHSGTDFSVRKGDRIAQLILECIKTPEVELVDKISSTQRGRNGFGSTGV